MKKVIDYIIKNNIGKYEENSSLKKYNTFKLDVLAKLIVFPSNIESLIKLIKYLKKENIQYKVIGKASNLVFSSKSYNSILIKLDNLKKLNFIGNKVTVDAGHSLIKLSLECANNNLSGLEFASGIPATVGGAVVSNAEAYNSSVSKVLESVTVLNENNNIIKLSNSEIKFDYRKSIFKNNSKYIILEATFKLIKDERENIMKIIISRKQKRLETQPLDFPSAGSVFKNPENLYAGKLIEDLNLKGYIIGGAKISEKHANFIINHNNATGEDILSLVNYIKMKVKEEYNIDLETELEFVNF